MSPRQRLPLRHNLGSQPLALARKPPAAEGEAASRQMVLQAQGMDRATPPRYLPVALRCCSPPKPFLKPEGFCFKQVSHWSPDTPPQGDA